MPDFLKKTSKILEKEDKKVKKVEKVDFSPEKWKKSGKVEKVEKVDDLTPCYINIIRLPNINDFAPFFTPN